MKTNSRGFTLIELLVTISIIGVVFGVVITTAAGIQRSARDTERESELRQVQSSLQQYYADQNYFPNNDVISFGGALESPDNQQVYSSSLPTDPTTGQSYCYKSQISATDTTSCTTSANPGRCHFYSLCAKKESPAAGGSCICGADYNFEVTPL